MIIPFVGRMNRHPARNEGCPTWPRQPMELLGAMDGSSKDWRRATPRRQRLPVELAGSTLVFGTGTGRPTWQAMHCRARWQQQQLWAP